MIVARILGWILVAAAIVVAGIAFALWLSGQNFALLAGQIWYQTSPESLSTTQSVLQAIHPALWDYGLLPLLNRPLYQAITISFFTSFILGLILVFAFRRRRRRRRFS